MSCTKCKLKGGLFDAKKCQLMQLGPHNTGHFGQMGVSEPILNNSAISFTKSNFKEGIFNLKNWSCPCLPTNQICGDQILFGHFEFPFQQLN